MKTKMQLRHEREERINVFLEVFFNHFYEQFKLYFDNLDTFFYIIASLMDEVRGFIKHYPYDRIDWSKVTKMSFLDKTKLIDEFFKKINIPFKIDDVIKNGIFNVSFTDEEDIVQDNLVSGKSTLCDGGAHESIEVYDNNLVSDASVWVHEISHHLNIDIHNIDIVRSLLTESLAFAYEFIFLDFLDEKEYNYEADKLKYHEFENLFFSLCNAYPIIKLYMIFEKLGKVSRNNYRLFFGYDNDYDRCLEALDDFLEKENYLHIFLHLRYSLAFAISNYMYIEYTKDNSFVQKMNELNEAIKTKDIYECLKIIDINGINDIEFEKIVKNIGLMIDELLNGFDRTVAKASLVEAYLDEFTTLFNEKTMLYENMDKLLKLIDFLRYHISGYIGFVVPEVEISKLSKATKEEKYKLIEYFYKYIGRKKSLDRKKQEIEVEKENMDEIMATGDSSFLVKRSLSGTSYFDEEKKEKHAIVHDTGYVLDTVAWIHEFRHLDNQPNKVRNEVSFLLTESISFVEELIFCDFLEEAGYSYEAAFCKYDFLSNLDVFIEDTYSMMKMLNLFIKNGKISKPDYYRTYKDDNYEDILFETLTLLTDDPEDILSGIRYTVASALVIYMYMEYKKDKRFMRKIELLNNLINTQDIYTCLKIIGLSGLDKESLDKVKLALDKFKKELDDIARKNAITLFDMEKGLTL